LRESTLISEIFLGKEGKILLKKVLGFWGMFPSLKNYIFYGMESGE
jgi:hypothetical protein